MLRARRLFLPILLAVLAGCGAPLTRGVPDGAVRPVPAPPPVAAAPRTAPEAARARADRRIPAADLDWLAARELMVPVDGLAVRRVPDTFDALRRDGDGRTRAHAALDLLAPRGTAVLAADDGVIARLTSNALGGITIYQRDAGDRFVHYYAHLDRYRDGLAVGDRVAKGTVLGYVGTTGNAPRDVPHLHWQLMRRADGARWWEGVPLNPWHFLVHDGRAMPGAGVAAGQGR